MIELVSLIVVNPFIADTSKCNVDICVGLSSGTASMNENYNGNSNNKDGSGNLMFVARIISYICRVHRASASSI